MISPSAGGDDVFAVKISATVEWYEWDPETPGGGSWVYVGQTGLSAAEGKRYQHLSSLFLFVGLMGEVLDAGLEGNLQHPG